MKLQKVLVLSSWPGMMACFSYREHWKLKTAGRQQGGVVVVEPSREMIRKREALRGSGQRSSEKEDERSWEI